MRASILIVDDNRRVFESLEPNFHHFGISTFYAENTSSAYRNVIENVIDAVLLDVMLGDESGIDTLKKIKELNPDIPVIMITGYASVDSAVESMRLGAFDYVKKPLNFDHLLKVVENALELYKLNEENNVLKRRIQELSPKVYVQNPRMLNLIEEALKLARTNIPVLIVGENGSGKEVIADYIHSNSDRVANKMVKINCAAFPESLLDNELFGHEKGSYTGADREFLGVFERANNSTLFLDEIGDMPLTIQAKILRVLQSNEIRRIGGSETRTVDVRFIAATNRDIGDQIKKGDFRQDLFYRLNTALLTVPPLRERKEDIDLLISYFLKEFADSHDKPVTDISNTVRGLFFDYNWPGNVRELKNTINYAVAISSGSSLEESDLPPAFRRVKTSESDNLNIRLVMEKELIEKTLHQYHYNKKKTAEMLNMSRKTLYSKINRYGINI